VSAPLKSFGEWPLSGLAFASFPKQNFAKPMSSQDPRIEAIFHEALTGADTERKEFVTRLCGDDEVLHQEVQRLLAAHEEAGSYFESPNSPAIESELARLKPRKR
jgi:hypothetical protein